jgi:putative proteasome-type protease
MFDVANLLADAIRDIERRDGPYLAESDIRFNASFILGGQIIGEPMRLNQRPTARRLVVINAEVCRCENPGTDRRLRWQAGGDQTTSPVGRP